MVKTEIEKLEERIEKLETNFGKKSKSDAEKKPRKQSEYNIFMKDYIESEKKKDSSKTHQELFTAGAKAWTAKKEKV